MIAKHIDLPSPNSDERGTCMKRRDLLYKLQATSRFRKWSQSLWDLVSNH